MCKNSKTTRALNKEFQGNHELEHETILGAMKALMTEQTIVLGELRAQLQAPQVCTPGVMIPTPASDTAVAE